MWVDGKSERLPGADLQPVGCDHFKSRPVAHARVSERIICARVKRNERTRFHSYATHLNFIHFDRHEPSRRYVIPVRLSLDLPVCPVKPALRVDAVFLRARCIKKMSILHRKVTVNLNIAVFKSILRNILMCKRSPSKVLFLLVTDMFQEVNLILLKISKILKLDFLKEYLSIFKLEAI